MGKKKEYTEERRNMKNGYNYTSEMNGRSYAYFDCPFCDESVKAYIWSISGGGKKCTCGAILHFGAAFKKTLVNTNHPPQQRG